MRLARSSDFDVLGNCACYCPCFSITWRSKANWNNFWLHNYSLKMHV